MVRAEVARWSGDSFFELEALTAIQIPDICERDIDLLLLEEFVASSEFQSWFLSQIGIQGTLILQDAQRSVVTASGESDLELTFKGDGKAIKVLIENKVDAAFQPNQPQRYSERALEYRKRDKYQETITVIVAPEVYFGGVDSLLGFDARITYETILLWFQTESKLGERLKYKIALLEGAITRGRVGWKLIPNEHVSQFWRKYWELAGSIAPELSMPVPKKEIPADSNFILFRPAGLPQTVSLYHKVSYGNVDLQFGGMGDKLEEMELKYRSALVPPMCIEKAAKSAVIRIRVEPVDMTVSSFEDAEPIMRKGIEAAMFLLDWYRRLT